jgi:hypothetical protein
MTSKYSNLLKDFDDFKQENLKLQMEVKTVETQLTNLNNDEMNGLATNQLNPTSFANILKSKKDSPISEPMVEIINTFNNYSKQKKSRENNVIIFGLKNISKETASDKVNSLFNKMHIVDIKFNNPVLLVKKGVTNTSPPLRISLENEDTKFQLLKAAKILKEINSNERTNISISQDLNEIDRLMHKKLLNEKKALNNKLVSDGINEYYYGIRGNGIVKINK